jgi:type III secretion protein T
MDGGAAWFYLHLKAFAFAVPRLLAFFAILPLLSREALPLFLRMGVVGSFALLLVPALVEGAGTNPDMMTTIAIILKETFVGVVLGFVIALPLWALETMGDLVDTQRGAAIAQTLNPLTSHESTPLGQLFNTAVVTFLFVIGGFLLLLNVLYESYRIWPVFGWMPSFPADASRMGLELLDKYMRLAVLLSAPVIFCMFLAEAGMAIVSRFVPQLQVFFLAMPVKSAIAMVVFAIYAIVLFDYTHDLLLETFREANRTIFGLFKGVRAP